jgi:hypothetical protein
MVDEKFGFAIMGVIVLVLCLIYIFNFLAPTIFDLHLAMAMIFFVWALNWSRSNLGNIRIAVLYAALLVYLTVYKHLQITIVILILLFLATFGKGLFETLFKGSDAKGPSLVVLKDAPPR